MPTYLHPGVYIEEIPSGVKPIEGVSTSVTAFVGSANRGPAGEATLIGKLDDYVSEYGNIALPAYETLSKMLTPEQMWSSKNMRFTNRLDIPIDVSDESKISTFLSILKSFSISL